jgi:hypothetical protein
MLITGSIVAPVAYWRSGIAGLVSAAVAWATCLVSGLLALCLAQLFNDLNKFLYEVLAGSLVRTALPLGAALAVHLQGGVLAKAGFLYYILAFYLVTLVVETVMAAATQIRRPPDSQTS